jgi:hypothetical protein
MGPIKVGRLLAAVSVLAVPSTLPAQLPRTQTMSAQEQPLGIFRGRVDKEVRLTLRGGDVSSTTLSGTELRARYRLTSPLPQQEGTVRVALEAGRGDVSVIQQPNASNGYTAIVRVYDRSGGADQYRFSTYFTPTLDTRVGRGRGAYGRGRGGYNNNNLPALHWSGDVDGVLELTWRGGTVQSRAYSGRPARSVTLTNTGDVTAVMNGNANAQVQVTPRQGRGQVEIVQQPTAANRYTTRIRITDPQAGYGHYEFDALWR